MLCSWGVNAGTAHICGRLKSVKSFIRLTEKLYYTAITDHVCNKNHVIDWDKAKVIDRTSDKAGRHIRDASEVTTIWRYTNVYIIIIIIWIRKTDNMNRDEGSYQLSHVWDKLLHTDDRYRQSVLMKTYDVKSKCR